MDERKEIQIKIEQNQTDKQKLIDEGKTLADKLAALDKPQLRHGDYGTAIASSGRLMLKDIGGQWFTAGKECCVSPGNDSFGPATILGNIFDDLKRNAEDLWEFEVDLYKDDEDGFAAEYNESDDNRVIGIGDKGEDFWYYTIDQATDIHQKLGQVIAFAKRKQAK